jgi:hypothetical protein
VSHTSGIPDVWSESIVGDEERGNLRELHIDLAQADRNAAPGVEQKFLVANLDQRLGPNRFGSGCGEPVPSKVTLKTLSASPFVAPSKPITGAAQSKVAAFCA